MRTVSLSITETDIARGEPRNPLYCAGALCFKRAFPGASVVVWHDRVILNGRPYPLPQAVRDWICNADDDCTPMRVEPRPLCFELAVEDSLFGEG